MTKKRDKKRMNRMVKYMQNYWSTYSDQQNYEIFSEDTFIDDALYAIGVALNEKDYMFASGFRRFKQSLRERLDNEP